MDSASPEVEDSSCRSSYKMRRIYRLHPKNNAPLWSSFEYLSQSRNIQAHRKASRRIVSVIIVEVVVVEGQAGPFNVETCCGCGCHVGLTWIHPTSIRGLASIYKAACQATACASTLACLLQTGINIID